MSDLWGLVHDGLVFGRVPAGYVVPAGSLLEMVPPEVADALSFAWPETEPEPPSVPQEVTNFQARAALLRAGLFEVVDAAIMALPRTKEAWQAWEYANTISRGGALVNAMAFSLGLTEAQIDDLFRAAAQIEA